MEWLGSNRQSQVSAGSPVLTKTNYLIGNNPRLWRTNIENHARVVYRGLYPGVDLVYYGTSQELEYDLMLAPNVDPGIVELKISGANVQLNRQGDLILATRSGMLLHRKPRAYQQDGGSRKWVSSRFKVRAGGRVSFEVGPYDKTMPLIIDPVWTYSEYFGGAVNSSGAAVATDGSGCIYITGQTGDYAETYLNSFPTTPGSFQPSLPYSNVHAFVSKISADGSAFVYSTYLGGSFEDVANSIAVSPSGNAYVTGHTSSADFPTTPGAFQSRFIGRAQFDSEAFVAELSLSGGNLIYSTLLGGPNGDSGSGIALDSAGNAYVTGLMKSPSFPITPGALQTSSRGVLQAFIAKINPTGTALVFSTLLGGTESTQGTALAVDRSGAVYLTGRTYQGFPTTTGAFQTRPPFPETEHAFVSKIDPSGGALVYSTLLTGTVDSYGPDVGTGITIDTAGNAYVTGYTSNPTFPATAGSFRTNYDTIANSEHILTLIFAAKINPSGSGLVYATFLGASLTNEYTGQSSIAVDSSGNAYLAGRTAGRQFPVTGDAFLSSNPWAGESLDAGYFSILSPDGSALKYSTYWAPASGLALDSNGYAYLTGSAIAYFDYSVVMLAKIQAGPPQPSRLTIAKGHSGNFVQGQNGATYTVTVGNATGAGSTSGLVTVTEIVPAGMALASMSGGPTWNCSVPPTCSTSSVINGGSSYSPIVVTVNVVGSATSPQVNGVTVSGGGSETANASDSTIILVPVTFQTIPAGLRFSIDGGGPQTAPRTLNLVAGQHTVAVETPQAGSAGTQYLFTGWSDAGASSHTIDVGGTGTGYSASFKTQYQLTTAALPSVGGMVDPAGGSFLDSGTSVIVTATSIPPYTFSSWTGAAAGSSTPVSVSMDGPKSVIGTFAVPGFTCDLDGDSVTSVADAQRIIDEALGVAPAAHDLNEDSAVNVVDVQIVINAATGLGCTAR